MRKFPGRVSAAHEGAHFLPALVVFRRYGVCSSVNMIVDTGSGTTIIGEGDLNRSGLTLDMLRRSRHPIAGWGGTTEAYEVPDVSIVLVDSDGKEGVFDAPGVLCGADPKKLRQKRGVRSGFRISIPSVVGRDFLRAHGFVVHIDVAREEVYLFTH